MDIINKIKSCCDYRSLTQLSEDLEQVGVTIQPLASGKHILCRIYDGKPIADEIIEDFIYLEKQSLLEDITALQRDIIVDFVERNTTENRLATDKKDYHVNYNLYGKAFGV